MPASHVQIGGDLVDEAILKSVLVTSELNQHATCVVVVRQTPDQRPDVEAMLGKPVQVLTYDSDGAPNIAFDGFVQKARLEYELSGSYSAVITAVSQSYRMDVAPRESYWRQSTLSGVANALSGNAGISCQVNCAARPARNYVQWGEADFPFLVRIADDYQGWIRTVPQGIEIRDSFDDGPELKWRAEGGLLSLKVSGKLGLKSFAGTHYNAYTMLSKTLSDVQASPEFTGASGRFCAAVMQASGQMPAGQLTRDDRAATSGEYQDVLRQEHERSLGGSVMASGISRVDQVRAGSTVTISGDLDAAGTYGVVKVVHRWSPHGYENEFWSTPWKKYINPRRPEGAKIHGVVAARVVSHNDEKKMGRLQVRYDWQQEGATAWARMAMPHAGADRGFLFLPEIGDEVLVAFEQGDPERPYILGSLWNGVDTAPREDFWGGDVEPNDIKRIVTKSGHRIQLSDKPGKEAIVIATPSKLKISLLEKADETGRPMVLLNAADGDMVFNAPNGRIHFHSKYFSREIGGDGAVPSAPPAPPSAPAGPASPIKAVAVAVGALVAKAKKFWDRGKPTSETKGPNLKIGMEQGILDKDPHPAAEVTWLSKEGALKSWGDQNNNLQLGAYSAELSSGIKKEDGGYSVSAIEAQVSATALHAQGDVKTAGGLLEGTGSVDVGQVDAYAQVGLDLTGKAMKATAEVGAEATAIKGDVGGQFNIPLFGKILTVGGGVEGMVGVAAKAGGELGWTSKEGFVASGETKVGFGPGLGVWFKLGFKDKNE